MARVRVVTDSTAAFEDPRFPQTYGVAVVPLSVHLGSHVLRDGIDIDAEEMLQRLPHLTVPPTLIAPPVSAFEAVYHELGRATDQICVVVHSQHFTDTYANAQTARSALLGRCEIMVIDSRTTSAGLGYLVEATVQAAEAGLPLDDVVRVARGIIPRLYSVFYVSTLDYIQQAGLIGEAQSTLGRMLGIKPLLTIEDGRLITMEKARTHAQAIDKIMEFVTEFTHIDRLCILQNTLRVTEQTQMLRERLALEFTSHVQAPVTLYGPLLASRIGPDAMGLVIMEGDTAALPPDRPTGLVNLNWGI